MERWFMLGVIVLLFILFVAIYADILAKRRRVSQVRAGLDSILQHSYQVLNPTNTGIALARQAYNDAVLEYNLTLRRFPGDIVGALLRLLALERIESTEEAR